MSAQVVGGWLIVACDAPDAAQVEIAVGKPEGWVPAFRDFSDGVRVAKIRFPEQTGRVRAFLRVAGKVSSAGVISN